jgi:hypothetical protein
VVGFLYIYIYKREREREKKKKERLKREELSIRNIHVIAKYFHFEIKTK